MPRNHVSDKKSMEVLRILTSRGELNITSAMEVGDEVFGREVALYGKDRHK